MVDYTCHVADIVLAVLTHLRSHYVEYIAKWEEKLESFRKTLTDLYIMKDDLVKKVEEGENRLEKKTSQVEKWLEDVQNLCKNERLREIMLMDIETAKWVVKIMEKSNLKKCISEERVMQEVVVKVLRKLKEEIENSEDDETRQTAEGGYNNVAEVVVEMMMDSVEELTRLMKQDKRMAVIAVRTLSKRDLEMLTIGDTEMEDIVRETRNASTEEDHEDENSDVLVAAPAKELISLRGDWVTNVGKLIDDPNFKKAVPMSEFVKVCLDIMGGLWISSSGLKQELDYNIAQQNSRWYRYSISKAAEEMTALVMNHISKCPPGSAVTVAESTPRLIPMSSKFLTELESRTNLLRQTLELLNDDQVKAVGLYGMGGIGKTVLANEISTKANLSGFKVIKVNVTDAPNIKKIQSIIASSIGLCLNSIDNIVQRAEILHDKLNKCKKGLKILVIMDDVWRKLNLDEIGLPVSACKLLLVARDKDVFRVMGVKDVNILKVDLVNLSEARLLLKSQTGNLVVTRNYEKVVEKLLSNCDGLPLTIVTRAESLKDKDLSDWEEIAKYWEIPISSHGASDYQHAYSVLSTSYKFITDNKQRMFFLLSCLFPLGSNISIESLMRYGIGLRLFEQVSNLGEAMDKAIKWSNELVSSSVLFKDDDKGTVKIHNLVRACAILFAAKDEKEIPPTTRMYDNTIPKMTICLSLAAEKRHFLVDHIPSWTEDDTFNEYTAVSLISNYESLSGIEASKLQILKLRGDSSTHFDDFFFDGMLDLKVLDLSNMNLYPRLPSSLWELKKLKTLCLEDSKLGDLKQIGAFVNLLVLSLTESLPGEIGKLHKLRLLDLSGCVSSKEPLIPADVLDKLSRLEGLYILNTTQALTATKSGAEGTSATWYHKFPRLNALEIQVAHFDELPIDGQAAQHLDRFKVYIGGDWRTIDETLTQFRRVMSLNGIDLFSGMLGKSCLVLLKKADWLKIHRCTNFENLIPQLDKGFRDLTSLNIHSCNDVKCIAKGSGLNDLLAFPHLRELDLYDLKSLKMVCDGDVPQGTFSNLQILHLRCLWALEYVLPLALLPPNLTRVDVVDCESLNFMFIQNEETEVVELSFLKSLTISGSPSLASLVSPENIHNTSAALQVTPIFFDAKMVFPSLEIFKLVDCPNVIKLWSKDLDAQGFQNLKEIMIRGCDKLLSIGSPGVFSTLVRLETLCIMGCRAIREVVTLEDTERGEHIIRFPKLKYLELDDLESIETFYGGRSDLEFPQLQRLKLNNLKRMSRFANAENSSALFHGKIKFPRLEELHVSNVNDEVTGLWDSKSCGVERGSVVSNPAPMLKELNVRGTEGLQPMLLRLFIRWAVPLSDMKLKDMGKDSEPDTSIRRAEQVGSYDKLHFYQRSM